MENPHASFSFDIILIHWSFNWKITGYPMQKSQRAKDADRIPHIHRTVGCLTAYRSLSRWSRMTPSSAHRDTFISDMSQANAGWSLWILGLAKGYLIRNINWLRDKKKWTSNYKKLKLLCFYHQRFWQLSTLESKYALGNIFWNNEYMFS